MTYYIAKTVSGGFDDVIARVTEALKAEGFGVLEWPRPRDLPGQLLPPAPIRSLGWRRRQHCSGIETPRADPRSSCPHG